jgi:hypothetical protein
MAEPPDDLLEPEDTPEEPTEPPADEDDEPRWSAEESLGLLPPD